MNHAPWLPRGFDLPDGSKVRSLLHDGEKWQIFETTGPALILLALPELEQKWDEFGFLSDSLFGMVSCGGGKFRTLFSPRDYVLAPADDGRIPATKVDALAFALALRESRTIRDDVSFHDAVYVEQYSRLLPVWTQTPAVDDKVVLGTWLTGGVAVSTDAFHRLCALAVWANPGDLAGIVKAAGIEPPANAVLPGSGSAARTAGAPEPGRAQDVSTQKGSGESRTFKLPGRPHLEKFFNEHVIDIILHVEKYQSFGIHFPSAIVLQGPPGCGKTFAVERLTEFIGWPSFFINSNTVGSPYIHDTSKKISEVFDKAIDSAPSVLVIDEMESFLTDRRVGQSSGLHHVEEVAEFLRRIPEAVERHVLIIAMTNLIDLIDPAILRRGRFDHIIEVGMPSRAEVKSLLESLLEKMPKAGHLDLDPALDLLEGRALSDSAFVVREAARLAARAEKTQISQEDLDTALKSLPKVQNKK